MSPFPLNRSVPSIEVIETKIMRVFFRDQILCPWGGGYCRRWPIRGCADEQGMVFILSVLKKEYNFAKVCPKQCTCPLS